MLKHSPMDYRQPLVNLWTVFLLGLLFHTDLGLMPLFHNLSVAENPANNLGEIAPILWGMLAFFLLPLVAIIVLSLGQSHRIRKIHFWGTVLYSVLNLAHLMADLMLEEVLWYQIFLMVFLLAVGLLINLLAWQWLKGVKPIPVPSP